MNKVQVSDMVSHIRAILDENETNTSLSGVSGVRQLSVEDVIKSHLVAGVDAVAMLAPAFMLEATSSTFATSQRHLIIPSEALKVLWIKANGWNRSVTEVHDPAESLYKAARVGRVGSLCNANSPLAFELSESFNPYGAEVLNYGGEVASLPEEPTLNTVYYNTTDGHSYKCTREKTRNGYSYCDYDGGEPIQDQGVAGELDMVNYTVPYSLEIQGEDYDVLLVDDDSMGETVIMTCNNDGEIDGNSEYVRIEYDHETLTLEHQYSIVCRYVAYLNARYTDLGVFPTNEATVRTLECVPEPQSDNPCGWVQYAQKAKIVDEQINVSEKVYEASCLYIAGLVCDSLGWAKNRDYKADAFLMLGLQTQQING